MARLGATLHSTVLLVPTIGGEHSPVVMMTVSLTLTALVRCLAVHDVAPVPATFDMGMPRASRAPDTVGTRHVSSRRGRCSYYSLKMLVNASWASGSAASTCPSKIDFCSIASQGPFALLKISL